MKTIFSQRSASIEPIWQNKGDMSTFAAQKISINLSGYKNIAISFLPAADLSNLQLKIATDIIFIFPIDGTQYTAYSGITRPSQNIMVLRGVTADSGGVSFSNATYVLTWSNTDNAYMIPKAIYGLP